MQKRVLSKSKSGRESILLGLAWAMVPACGYIPNPNLKDEVGEDTSSTDTDSTDTGSTDTGSTDMGSEDTGSTDTTSSEDTGSADTSSTTGDSCEGDMVFIQGGTFADLDLVDHDIADFCLDITEVTTAAYGLCVDMGDCAAPDESTNCNWNEAGKDDHPVNCVLAYDADAYCAWAGKELPDEWAWEWAARSRDMGWTYAWGDEAPGDTHACWSGGMNPPAGTCEVGSFPAGASVDGVLDLAGNVWEWTSTMNDQSRAIRGGGWTNVNASNLAASFRHDSNPSFRTINFGFRCARTP